MIADLPHEVCSIDHWRCSALPVVRSNCPTVLLRLSAFSPLMLWGSWSLPLESFNSPFITRCDIAAAERCKELASKRMMIALRSHNLSQRVNNCGSSSARQRQTPRRWSGKSTTLKQRCRRCIPRSVCYDEKSIAVNSNLVSLVLRRTNWPSTSSTDCTLRRRSSSTPSRS